VLKATNQPDVHHEMSENAILSFSFDQETRVEQGKAETTPMLDVFKDIDKESTITLVEIHQSSMGKAADKIRAFHVFIVFKTTSEADGGVYWWSLEKDTEYIILQRSRNKDDVKNNKKGVRRKRIRPIKEDLIGRGNLQYLFALLWGQQLIPTKYNIFMSNCQTFVAIISRQVTEEEYEYRGYFQHSSPTECDQHAKIIRVLIKLAPTTKHPLLNAIDSEEADRLDGMIVTGNYNVDGIYSGVTLLHYAIVCSKTTMVQHLLEKHKVDPAKCSPEGIGSLHLAAYFAKTTNTLKVILETGAFDVNRVDENGDTALFYALAGDNSLENVCHLIERGADPDIANRKGVTPMNVVGTEKKKKLEDIMKQKRKLYIYMNHVAPSPIAATNAADDTSGDNQRDPALACASRTLSKHGPSERLFSGLRKFSTNKWYEYRSYCNSKVRDIAKSHGFRGSSQEYRISQA
jgi:hypothetical protein